MNMDLAILLKVLRKFPPNIRRFNMGGIVWLASYPKSGNTWLRTFLHNLFLNAESPVDINQMNSLTLSDNSKFWYEKVAGRPYESLSEQDISALTPKVHEAYTRIRSDSVFVKTHHFLGENNGVPLITPQYTAGAIYILRNPLDTVISVADHYGLTIDEGIDMMNERKTYIGASATAGPDYLSSWSEHVSSWQVMAQSALHIMRYEDMLFKPLKTFGALSRFLGLKPPQSRLKKAIKFSSFDTSRKQEKEKGFIEQSDKNERFFRAGKAGQWKSTLTDDQVKRVVSVHEEVMEKYGYLPSSQ